MAFGRLDGGFPSVAWLLYDLQPEPFTIWQ
jgi:hypothetical protein